MKKKTIKNLKHVAKTVDGAWDEALSPKVRLTWLTVAVGYCQQAINELRRADPPEFDVKYRVEESATRAAQFIDTVFDLSQSSMGQCQCGMFRQLCEDYPEYDPFLHSPVSSCDVCGGRTYRAVKDAADNIHLFCEKCWRSHTRFVNSVGDKNG